LGLHEDEPFESPIYSREFSKSADFAACPHRGKHARKGSCWRELNHQAGYATQSRILRSIGGEPAYAAEVANQIADNNLTVNVSTSANDRSSLMYSMARMRTQLVAAIEAVKVSANAIASASSSRTEEQVASLQKTAASME
jgi:hypothetical protein